MFKILFLFVILFQFNIISQQFSNWKNYTNMKNVNSVVGQDKILWGATNGGAFLYNASDETYLTLNKVNGLSGLSLTAITIDSNNKIWFGSNSGSIDVYNQVTKSFNNILDIFFNTDKISKKINELGITGDTVIVSTDFGISLIDANNYFFYDTFSKFGDLPSNIPVNSALKSTLLFVCTDQGIAVQKQAATNLLAPESWNVYKTSDGLPSDITHKIVSYNGSVIAATAGGLAVYNDSGWIPFIPQLNSLSINDLFISGDSLFILSGSSNVYSYFNNELVHLYSSSSNDLIELGYLTRTGILASSLNGIIVIKDNSRILPNGPFANQFPDLTVDRNSVLWSASGTDVAGVGFYKLDSETWENFNMSNTPELPSNAYHVVYASEDNSKYFGSWGQGFIRIKDGEINNFNSDNTGMQGIIENTNFLVISGFSKDPSNNLWVLNFASANQKILSLMTADEQWHHFNVPSTGTVYSSHYFNLVIDQYGTKWFCSQTTPRQGLFYFNEGSNPDPSAINDDVSGYLTESSGLNNNFITSIAVDRRGDIWVGTSLGVNIISNVGSVLSGNPQLRISSVFSLRQQTITAILVDPLNQKWIGTNQGLHLINSDGTSLLASFNSTNSALLSDQITSLAIDENTGTIYVGTDNRGITAFKTTSVKPKESFEDLFAFPNPFILNKQNNLITIDGLIRDTDIKILTINGKLVKQFTTPGGRVALWDGRDELGDLVPSGI